MKLIMENWREFKNAHQLLDERRELHDVPEVNPAEKGGRYMSNIAEPTLFDDRWRSAMESVLATYPELKKYSRSEIYQTRMNNEIKRQVQDIMHDDRVKIITKVLKHVCILVGPCPYNI